MTIIMACGDVGVRRADCSSIFAGCHAVLNSADLCFAQLETTVSTRGAPVPNARLAMRAPPQMLESVKNAGIDVMSFAGNHCLDFGYDAFADTLDHAGAAGIAVCGAGANLQAARRPALLNASGMRVAVLAANSILPEGYAADKQKPGCAPLRAHTVYQQIETDQPGTPARIVSYPHRGDLQALVDAVRGARQSSDVVLVSLHWGIHMVRSSLADYQIEVAHALIEAGCDAVLGHHPHLLKGVEIYRGKAIFYSLGNFAIEQPHIWDPSITDSDSFRNLVSLNATWNLDQVYMLPPATRLTGVVKLVCEAAGPWQVRFLPAWINDDSAPQMLTSQDPKFAEVADFLEQSSRECGLTTQFTRDGDELLLTA